MAATIRRLCFDSALSCGERNRFLCDSASSTPPSFVSFKCLSFSAALSLSVVPNVKGNCEHFILNHHRESILLSSLLVKNLKIIIKRPERMGSKYHNREFLIGEFRLVGFIYSFFLQGKQRAGKFNIWGIC